MSRRSVLGGILGSGEPPVEETYQAEVNEKWFGGKKVKETKVRKKGRKTQARQTTTDIDAYGHRTGTKKTVEGDDI